MEQEIRFIAVEGVIGAGKTSLVKKLRDKLLARTVFEKFEENPFLERFYKDRKRWAYQTQMFFLINRFKQLQDLNQEQLFTDYIVCDYIFEKDKIFAYLNLDLDELKLYEALFPLLRRNLRKPDLVVYLQSSVDRLMENIKQRGRKFEDPITRQYIEELSEAYNHFFFRYQDTPLLMVNSTEIDFVNNENDFDDLLKAIFRKDRAFIEYYNPESRKTL
jgi:deoxyadenosine/deoxycytidine kinase